MANEINLSARMSITVGDLTLAGNGSSLLSLSSSNSYYNSFPQIVNPGSWVALNTGSATNIRYFYLVNNPVNGTGSILNIALNSAGSGSFTSLQPNDFLIIPGSGSQGYFLHAVSSSVQCQIVLTQA